MSAEGHSAQNHRCIDRSRRGVQRLLNLGEITAAVFDVAAFRYSQTISRERSAEEFSR